MSPTDRWLAALPGLPRLSEQAQIAERLLLLLHYGVDWSTWIARHRKTYWSAILPNRVIRATYRANSLPRWWTLASSDLCSAPRNAAERAEAVTLLSRDSAPVLRLLREETEPLLLRLRLVADAVRQARIDSPSRETDSTIGSHERALA